MEELWNKLYTKNNQDAIDYLFEIISLSNELDDLQVEFRLQYPFLFNQKIVTEANESCFHDYIFYLKNSIYRLYDLLNKYALFINSIDEYYKRENRTPGWTDLLKNLENIEDPKLAEKIRRTSKDKDIRRILGDRKRMTHSKLVRFQENFLTTFVLPLEGELAKDKLEWIRSSYKILDSAKKRIEDLIKYTENRLHIPE
jgi:hypothetical protein